MEINELLEMDKKLNEILNQANSEFDQSITSRTRTNRLLVSDLEDAKKRILILIGESTVLKHNRLTSLCGGESTASNKEKKA
jgi:hypothetical protein